MEKAKKRNCYTLKDKVKAIKLVESGEKQGEVAKKLDIPRGKIKQPIGAVEGWSVNVR